MRLTSLVSLLFRLEPRQLQTAKTTTVVGTITPRDGTRLDRTAPAPDNKRYTTPQTDGTLFTAHRLAYGSRSIYRRESVVSHILVRQLGSDVSCCSMRHPLVQACFGCVFYIRVWERQHVMRRGRKPPNLKVLLINTSCGR